jgi:hypothetical protein
LRSVSAYILKAESPNVLLRHWRRAGDIHYDFRSGPTTGRKKFQTGRARPGRPKGDDRIRSSSCRHPKKDRTFESTSIGQGSPGAGRTAAAQAGRAAAHAPTEIALIFRGARHSRTSSRVRGFSPLDQVCDYFNCENLKELVQLGRSPNEPNYLRTSDVASLGRQREPMNLVVHILPHIEPISLPCDAT